MIQSDQFQNLPEDLVFVFSDKSDGTVLDRTGVISQQEIIKNRQKICQRAGISYEEVVFQKIVYSGASTYDVLQEVDETFTSKYVSEVEADGIITQSPGVGIFLPVADCIVTVLYDPKQRVLAQLHMGRHSSLTNLIEKTINAFIDKGSFAENIKVWMAPAAKAENYVLEYFHQADDPRWQPYALKDEHGYHLDLQGHNSSELVTLGVKPHHIFVSPIDTMDSTKYFSHARGDIAMRFAGLAMMR